MLAQRVDFYVSPTLAVVPPYENKQLRLLAVSSRERLERLPQVPTLKESGIDYVRFGWLGICAGEGTPQPIVELLNSRIAAIVATPEYKTMIENAGSIAISSTPAELRRVIHQTLDEVAATIQEFGLQQE
jgi:tripartite-type tricarboxylate transporter receptor subunit TctC